MTFCALLERIVRMCLCVTASADRCVFTDNRFKSYFTFKLRVNICSLPILDYIIKINFGYQFGLEFG